MIMTGSAIRIDARVAQAKSKAIKVREEKLKAYKNVAEASKKLATIVEENHFSLTVLRAVSEEDKCS